MIFLYQKIQIKNWSLCHRFYDTRPGELINVPGLMFVHLIVLEELKSAYVCTDRSMLYTLD